jgi:hypothetical protein
MLIKNGLVKLKVFISGGMSSPSMHTTFVPETLLRHIVQPLLLMNQLVRSSPICVPFT